MSHELPMRVLSGRHASYQRPTAHFGDLESGHILEECPGLTGYLQHRVTEVSIRVVPNDGCFLEYWP